MSIPTYSGISTALSGLEAMQAGLDTTSENISNASDPDYAEEVVNLTDSPDLLIAGSGDAGVPGLQIGTGVDVSSITRQDDPWIDNQYWSANAGSSYSSELAGQLGDVQSDLGSTSSDEILSSLSSFFQAWNGLADDPTNTSTVVQTGATLASQLSAASQTIATTQSDASDQLAALTSTTQGSEGEVAQYSTQIARLNTQIAGETAAGLSANDLQDQRSAVIDKLSGLLNLTVTPLSSGADTITVAGSSPAITLVDGTQADATTATAGIPSSASAYTAADGGTVGALAALADTNASDSDAPLAQLQSQLETFASSLNSDVTTPALSTALGGSGEQFFTTSAGPPWSISVNAGLTNPSTAVVSALQSSASTVAANQTTAANSLATFTSNVGNTVEQAQDASATASSLLTSISNQRQSVSGVSLDQEMSNMITYQQGYQASARAMNAMQTVIQDLISTVGGAGV